MDNAARDNADADPDQPPSPEPLYHHLQELSLNRAIAEVIALAMTARAQAAGELERFRAASPWRGIRW
jgi:hypothetical protein